MTHWQAHHNTDWSRPGTGEVEFIIGVMTHQGNLDQAMKQHGKNSTQLSAQRVATMYFVGDPNLQHEWQFDSTQGLLKLRCQDDYLNLPNKLFCFARAVAEIFPEAHGVFKTDDDTVINHNSLLGILRRYRRTAYYGYRIVIPSILTSDYLRNKTHVTGRFPEFAQYPIEMPPAAYCQGGGYYLRMSSIHRIAESGDLFRPFPSESYESFLSQDGVFRNLHLFEDMTVGLALRNRGIRPRDRRVKLAQAVQWEGMI